MWIQRGLGGSLLVAGALWWALFPKKASLDADMVASVCIGVGLLGSGALILPWHRVRRATAMLLLLLLWSLLGNVYWIAWSEDVADALLEMSEARGGSRRQEGPTVSGWQKVVPR